MRAIWHKPSEIRRHERELFKRFASDVKPKETMGLAPKHAPLSNCYGWTQSRDFVIVVVWLQGPSDDVTVEINDNHMLVQTEGYTPVIDRQLFSQVDERVDVETVSWDKLDLMALKLVKKDPGVIWDALFEGDWRLLRAVDAASYEALPDPSDPLDLLHLGLRARALLAERYRRSYHGAVRFCTYKGMDGMAKALQVSL